MDHDVDGETKATEQPVSPYRYACQEDSDNNQHQQVTPTLPLSLPNR
jgi:hypothetical protein